MPSCFDAIVSKVNPRGRDRELHCHFIDVDWVATAADDGEDKLAESLLF
jgi:hypothetical protein